MNQEAMHKRSRRMSIKWKEVSRNPSIVYFETKKEAVKVLRLVNDAIRLNGYCTIAEYYNFVVEVIPDLIPWIEPRDHEFGWFEHITQKTIQGKRGYAWSIDLPYAVRLRNETKKTKAD